MECSLYQGGSGDSQTPPVYAQFVVDDLNRVAGQLKEVAERLVGVAGVLVDASGALVDASETLAVAAELNAALNATLKERANERANKLERVAPASDGPHRGAKAARKSEATYGGLKLP